ncbi:MAG: serine/threonine-protein phosphatase [Prevotella sp.]|nr:serine/threonine-protein phosphatase [Prevotella sp.]
MRHDNEDMILAGYKFIRDDEYRTQLELGERDRYMMAVADGMGGHLSGEVASSDVLHNLQFFFSDLPVGLNASSFNEMIVGWLESINMILDSKGKADEQYKGMGTTLVALAYYDGDFYSMNCGDSRLYRLRNEELVQLTTDHSLSSLMGDQKHSSVITNCIGGGCTSSYIDVVHIVDIQDGDTYLLCSDGLTDMMSDNRLSILLAEGADANDLCNAAIVRGGFDNVSACLIKVKKE